MKCVIIEDETLAAVRLADLIKELAPDIHIEAILPSVLESVKWFTGNTTDLAFFDINLSDGNAFEIFDRTEVACPVIFTTAYNEYAIKAFRHNGIDYLLKPVVREELTAAIRKFRKMALGTTTNLKLLKNQFIEEVPAYQSRFLVRYGEKFRTIEATDIAWFQALEKSVFLSTFQGQMIAIDFSLDRLESMLDPRHFFRINRKITIAFRGIGTMTAVSRARILVHLKPPLSDPLKAIVSVERAQDFRKWLGEVK